jgi:cell division protease FtsH
LILTGPPGNGKTSACRWVREQCNNLNLEHKIVSPDDYQAARRSCNPSQAVRELFNVDGRGVIFFDDMDLALRDRSKSASPEDQAVFLGAMDGMHVNAGVVYIFTTNLSLDLIDPAFRRPGRIDVVLHLNLPTDVQRGQLFDRWHADIRAAVDRNQVIRDSEGMSFAELDEHKNLLVLRYVESNQWDWAWACQEFQRFRHELITPQLS